MKTLPLDNDWEALWPFTRHNTSTGILEAAAGLVGLTARLSATDGGAAIHANLSVSILERASTPGEYFGIIQGDDLRTHLAAYIGKVIWEVVGDGTNVFISEARRVRERRRA